MKRISALIVGTTLILAGIALQPLPAIAGDHDDDDDIDIVESPFPNVFDDDPFPTPFETRGAIVEDEFQEIVSPGGDNNGADSNLSSK